MTVGRATVIVCAYSEGRWDQLERAIASTLAEAAATDVVLVVDHNEDLRARSEVAFGPRRVRVMANRHERGLSGARTTGTDATDADLVVFLDDDAEGQAGWLAALLEPFSDPLVAGVGGWAEPAWADERPPRWWPATFDWVVGCSYVGLPGAGESIRNPIGAVMALRREVVDAVGGFRTGIGRIGATPLGCEETELCIRVRQRWPEFRFVHQPRAVVHHHVPAERASFRYFARRCLAEGRSKALVAQSVGRNHALASERTHVLRTLPRAVLGDLVGRGQARPAPRRAAAAVAGTALAAVGYARARGPRGEVDRAAR